MVTDDELRLLGYSGLLHDIGKTSIPKEILSTGPLFDTTERNIMNRHPRLGFLELRDSEYDMVKHIVVAHHEHKMTPYPRIGKDRRKTTRDAEERREINERISILVQIVAIADIYDALLSSRSYKVPLSKQKIEEILRLQFTGDCK